MSKIFNIIYLLTMLAMQAQVRPMFRLFRLFPTSPVPPWCSNPRPHGDETCVLNNCEGEISGRFAVKFIWWPSICSFYRRFFLSFALSLRQRATASLRRQSPVASLYLLSICITDMELVATTKHEDIIFRCRKEGKEPLKHKKKCNQRQRVSCWKKGVSVRSVSVFI